MSHRTVRHVLLYNQKLCVQRNFKSSILLLHYIIKKVATITKWTPMKRKQRPKQFLVMLVAAKKSTTSAKGNKKRYEKKNIMIQRMRTLNLIGLEFLDPQFSKERVVSPNWWNTKITTPNTLPWYSMPPVPCQITSPTNSNLNL